MCDCVPRHRGKDPYALRPEHTGVYVLEVSYVSKFLQEDFYAYASYVASQEGWLRTANSPRWRRRSDTSEEATHRKWVAISSIWIRNVNTIASCPTILAQICIVDEVPHPYRGT